MNKQPRPKQQKKRPTIGYLVSELQLDFSLLAWQGMTDAARKHDVDLISFIGGIMRPHTGFGGQANVLYDLAGPECLDGLIIWPPPIGVYLSKPEIDEFCRRYAASIPTVLLEEEIKDIPRVTVDVYQGMQWMVNHLIEVHGYRRIAFAGQFENQVGFQKRYRAFTDSMAAHNLPVEAKLTQPWFPDEFIYPGGLVDEKVFTSWVNEALQNGAEAFVGVSDTTAFQIIETLQSQGVQAPDDVAVVGFDNYRESWMITPPLTTVSPSFYKLGRQAVETLLPLLDGKPIAEETVVLPQLIIRQSCRCMNPTVMRAGAKMEKRLPQVESFAVAFNRRRPQIVSDIFQAANTLAVEGLQKQIERLLDAFEAELTGKTDAGFLQQLNKILRQVIAASGRVSDCQKIILVLRRYTLPCLDTAEAVFSAETLWQQAQIMIGKAAERAQAHQQFLAEQEANKLREVGQILNNTFDVGQLMDVLSKNLPQLNIPGCYVCLYENPQPYQYPQPAPEWSQLALAYTRQGQLLLEPEKQRFPSRQLVPEGVFSQEHQVNLIVEALYSQQNQIGFVLFEAGPHNGYVYEVLRRDISSALEGALLVQRVQEHAAEIARQKYVLDTFMDNVPDLIYFKDRESRFTQVNRAFIDRFDELNDFADVIGKTDFDLFSEEEARPKYEKEQQIIRIGQPLLAYEERYFDGRWALISKIPLRNEHGEIIGIFGITRDITLVKQAQETLAKQARQLQMVAEVSTATSTILDTADLLQRVVDLTKARFGLYHAHIYLLNDTGDTLNLVSGAGKAGRQMVAQEWNIPLVQEQSLVARAARTAEIVTVDNVREVPDWMPNPLLPNTHAEMAVPIMLEEVVVGVLDVQADTIGGLTESDANLLRTLANHVAVALTNARLFEQMEQAKEAAEQAKEEAEQAREEIETINEALEIQVWHTTGQAQLNDKIRGEQDIPTLANNIIQFLCRYLKAQLGALYIVDNHGLNLVGRYAYRSKNSTNRVEFGEDLVGQAALDKEPMVITNVPNDYITIRSGLGETIPGNILIFPFIYNEQLIGVIEMGTLAEFSQAQTDFLQTALDSIAIAFNTAQARHRINELLAETQQQAEELLVQGEELQATNEELEIQTESLRASEAQLREKQTALDKQNQELKIAQQELEQKAEELARASSYKSEFLANMSHELRTPLNSLLILARMLGDNEAGNLTPEQVESAQIIYNGGKDLLDLINDILDLSKVESGKLVLNFEVMPLNELTAMAETQFRHVAEEKGLALNLSLAGDLPAGIKTDRQRVKQIVKNLLSNAFKFTSQGSVSLSINRADAGVDLSRSNLEPGRAVAIRVADTGIGMTPEQQNLVFEAFQQADGSTSRHYGGTGLGLSISKDLALKLGGQLDVESEPGQGSTFTLYLPLEKTHEAKEGANREVKGQEPAASRPASLPAPGSTSQSSTAPEPETTFLADDRAELDIGHKVLLVIEDDPNFAKIVYEYSHKQGFKCLVAPDGAAGLELVKIYHPAAIILDLILPDMSGWEVLQALKHDPTARHIPVHIISIEDEVLDAYKQGAIGYLTKPVSPEQMIEVLQKIEGLLSREIKTLLVVEDDINLQRTLKKLLGGRDVQIIEARLGQDALELLQTQYCDCIILDLSLPDMTGFELLNKINTDEALSRCPVIVYTGRDLTAEENLELMQYANRIIVKGVKSPERLLDETALFLHRVVADMPHDKQQTIKQLYERDDFLKDKKVLIVDDDMRNSFALSKLLSDKGIVVKIARDGQKALDLLAENPDIDLILMDIMMPVLDGYETTKRIRAQQQFRALPILALTAKAMTGDREKCLAAGANDYLPKPVNIDRLFSMLRVWLFR